MKIREPISIAIAATFLVMTAYKSFVEPKPVPRPAFCKVWQETEAVKDGIKTVTKTCTDKQA